MRDQEIIGIWEAYQQVHTQPQEEVEQLDEAMSSYDRNRKRAAQRAAERNAARDRGQTGNVPGVGYVSPRRERETYTDERGQERHKSGARMPKKEDQKESFDLFDLILEHLVAEGYAETNEAALAIMANMSEEWKQSIFEDTAAIRANVPQPGQRTVSMTATGKEPAGDRLIRQAGQAISSFLGSRGVVKSEPASQRKPLVSRTVK